ncbi:MAG: hypothetical protein ACJAUP_001771 [Cellvibrionaceae bacterium]
MANGAEINAGHVNPYQALFSWTMPIWVVNAPKASVGAEQKGKHLFLPLLKRRVKASLLALNSV